MPSSTPASLPRPRWRAACASGRATRTPCRNGGGDEIADRETAEAWIAEVEAQLQSAGHHSTLPRSAIIALVGHQNCALTADQISQELHDGGRRVGISTVYRTLELLEELGLVQRLDIGDGLARFEPAFPGGEHHHHHFVCSRCGRVMPFEDEGVESAIAAAIDRFGQPVSEHEVILRSRGCTQCESSA